MSGSWRSRRLGSQAASGAKAAPMEEKPRQGRHRGRALALWRQPHSDEAAERQAASSSESRQRVQRRPARMLARLSSAGNAESLLLEQTGCRRSSHGNRVCAQAKGGREGRCTTKGGQVRARGRRAGTGTWPASGNVLRADEIVAERATQVSQLIRIAVSERTFDSGTVVATLCVLCVLSVQARFDAFLIERPVVVVQVVVLPQAVRAVGVILRIRVFRTRFGIAFRLCQFHGVLRFDAEFRWSERALAARESSEVALVRTQGRQNVTAARSSVAGAQGPSFSGGGERCGGAAVLRKERSAVARFALRVSSDQGAAVGAFGAGLLRFPGAVSVPMLAAAMAASAVLGSLVLFKSVRPLLTFRVATLAAGLVVLILVHAFALCKKSTAGFSGVKGSVFASVQFSEDIVNGGERGGQATGGIRQGYHHIEQGTNVVTDATYDIGQFLGHDTFG
eukprot:3025516-Pleurochrysis_carterae.AAC.4